MLKGLEGVVVAETELSDVDANAVNSLFAAMKSKTSSERTIRGCGRCCGLVPATDAQRGDWQARLAAAGSAHSSSFPRSAMR